MPSPEGWSKLSEILPSLSGDAVVDAVMFFGVGLFGLFVVTVLLVFTASLRGAPDEAKTAIILDMALGTLCVITILGSPAAIFFCGRALLTANMPRRPA